MSETRFVSPCTPPEGAARELLTILSEEGAEIMEILADLQKAVAGAQKRASKALRFGLDEVQPGQPHDNADRLAHEIGDFQVVVERLVALGVLRADAIAAGAANKRRQLAKYMQSTPDKA